MFALPLSRLADPMLLLLIAIFAGLLVLTRRGRLLRRRETRVAALVAWSGWLGLWAFSCPVVSSTLVNLVQLQPRDLRAELEGVPEDRRVLVLLTGGWLKPPRGDLTAPELIGGAAFPRAVGAARVYRKYGFGHVVVSGVPPPGLVGPGAVNSVVGIAETLVAFGVPEERIVREMLSTNTRENAVHSMLIARALGAERVVVVTSAVHMPRALRELAKLGHPVLAAPVDVNDPPSWNLLSCLPSTNGLDGTNQTIHELLGLLKP